MRKDCVRKKSNLEKDPESTHDTEFGMVGTKDLNERLMGSKSRQMSMRSGQRELHFTDEEKGTHRCHLISPSNKGIRTHHLIVPTIQALHPHISSDSDFMQPCQFGTIGWEKMKIVLDIIVSG